MQTDLQLPDGSSVHVRLDEALSVAYGPDRVDTFDRSGRLISSFRQGEHLRRGLDGRMLGRRRPPGGARQHRWLAAAETAAVIAQAQTEIAALRSATTDPDLQTVFARILNFNAAADVQSFHRVYKPVSILPPDQYQALVLQATEGCSFNTCTFCALYRDRPFHIKTPAEFSAHIAQVQAFLGAGIALRRSVFLADANALIVPQKRLLPLLDVLSQHFTLMPASIPAPQQRPWLRAHSRGITGLYAFVDGLSAERKSIADYRQLTERGLRRVYIGLESGCETLLTWLRKPSSASTMLDVVGRMKAAGLQVGVIVLTGVGGKRFHDCHCHDTAELLNAMPLDGNDIIYFSPFESDPEAPYDAIARADGIEPPTPERIQAQETAIRAALTLPDPPRGPKRVPYNLRDFIY
ncbi:MAG: radical SAM protein [Chloroflexi bacterium]|nr:radical SAM protein [Chloroflexota bacterium]